MKFSILRAAALAGAVAAAAVPAAAANLVVNGDFSAGNTGFGSDYHYAQPMYWQPDHYSIGTAAEGWVDHTTGDGAMLVVDGAFGRNPLWTVWRETLSVTPGATYAFGAWAISTCCSIGPVTQLAFYADDSAGTQLLGTLDLSKPPANLWQPFSAQWTAGAGSTLTLRIVNLSTNNSVPGNDFGLDDIVLRPVPEPASAALLAAGLLPLAAWCRRRAAAPLRRA